jgi:hypothetical protein
MLKMQDLSQKARDLSDYLIFRHRLNCLMGIKQQ